MVFGYGSNMDDAQMDQRCPAREKVGIAVLHDHRLCFPRLSNTRRCGVSSVEPSPGDVVWGVVHRLGVEDLAALDRSEGYQADRLPRQNGYNRLPVRVEIDGVATSVDTYIATATRNPPPPSEAYLRHICDGASQHSLPEFYRQYLHRLAITYGCSFDI